jgi:hypothetical protein
LGYIQLDASPRELLETGCLERNAVISRTQEEYGIVAKVIRFGGCDLVRIYIFHLSHTTADDCP